MRADQSSAVQRLRRFVIGKARSPHDPQVFHRLSLIAFLAWVGLGADPLSSSCYGPEEAFLALGGHYRLGILVALASASTILIISASYSQIIELFPTGGGGYLVASKLLSPTLGMVSGCALLLDYVLTITISVASGTDALFSFLPRAWLGYKLECAVLGIAVLIVLNLRGVKESVMSLAPIFLLFIATHAFAIVYVLGSHLIDLPQVARETAVDLRETYTALGLGGMLFLILRAYSMGAGTFTGIEAVSNGIPVLREPKVQTARVTMGYMAVSLSCVVLGLMLSYILYELRPQAGKTLNAVLFETMTGRWAQTPAQAFVLVALVSEAALLFIAAQAGFLDGPRVLANMALDRWAPTQFASLSDRLVSQNGILLMGAAALGTMLLTGGSVRLLVVLYSINVFITFTLSQAGMVRHWWGERRQAASWRRKIAINGIGLILTLSILVSVILMKFFEGGWVTLLITGGLITVAAAIRRNYTQTGRLLGRLRHLVTVVDAEEKESAAAAPESERPVAPQARTAVLLLNGFSGLGLHTLFTVRRQFGGLFENYVFMSVGLIDAGHFKGVAEIEGLRAQTEQGLNRYVHYMRRHGLNAEGVYALGIDIVDEVEKMAQGLLKRYPRALFFGGQLVFARDSLLNRILHNYTAFAIQRRLYGRGIPVFILPILLEGRPTNLRDAHPTKAS